MHSAQTEGPRIFIFDINDFNFISIFKLQNHVLDMLIWFFISNAGVAEAKS